MIRKQPLQTILSVFLLAMGVTPCDAAVRLPSYLTDNMVVQHDSRLTVAGSATPGSVVTAAPEWASGGISVKAGDDGSFRMTISTPPPGGPWALDISDNDGSISLENILSGEVWLCSGQSNMEFPVKGDWAQLYGNDKVLATAQHPDIRLLKIGKTMAYTPQTDLVTSGWQLSSPASVSGFSAVAYLFAERLWQELNVPVGVIDCSWGGTPAEAWTSAEALGCVPGFDATLAAMRSCAGDEVALQRLHEERTSSWMTSLFEFDPASVQTAGDGWRRFLPSGTATGGVPDAADGTVAAQYRLMVPPEYAGKPLTLRLGIFDDEDATYFNGQLIGHTSGSQAQRVYEVSSSLVKPMENVITCYISDFGGPGGFAPAQRSADFDGGVSIPIDGEWLISDVVPFDSGNPRPLPVVGAKSPTLLYNAMVAPLTPFPIRGVIWYQGCDNVGRADQYALLFPEMIRDWRRQRGAEFPFYFVQLAGFGQQNNLQPDSPWAALRQAQTEALKLPRTGMASAIDAGHPYDIHPTDKYRVADRLARLALALDYGKKIEYKAPEVKTVNVKDGKMTLTFDGDVIPGSCALTGFILGDADGNWAVANARQTGPRTVQLYSRRIPFPQEVKYNWADYPSGNLYGAGNLPVTPFYMSVR